MSPRPTPRPATTKDRTLYDDISEVCRFVGLSAVFLHDGDFVTYQHLARVAMAIVGTERWHRDPTYETRKIVRRAIDRIPLYMSGKNPDRPDSEADDNFWKGKPQREAAEILYGFRQKEIRAAYGYTPDDPLFQPRLTYKDDYRPAALKLLGLEHETDKNSIVRVFRIIWRELEKSLLTLEEEAHARREEAQRRKQEAEYAVHRQALYDELEKAISSRESEHLTWVWGDAGTGKSTAVNAVLDEIGDPAVTIDCSPDDYNPQKLNAQLVAVLREYKSLGDGASTDIREEFCNFLCGMEAPPYVVIDNYDTQLFGEVEDSEYHFTNTVIVQSRHPPADTVQERANVVEVGDLNDDESRELIRHFLPSADDQECEELTAALFHRALLINQACRLIRDYDDTVANYLKSISQLKNLKRYVFDRREDVSRSITAHYQHAIRRLRDGNPLALEILDVIMCLQAKAPRVGLETVWSEISEADNSDLYAVNANALGDIEMALRELKSLGLVREIDGNIERHYLTWTVLMALRLTEWDEKCFAIVSAVISIAKKWGWSARETLPMQLLWAATAAIPSIRKSILNVVADEEHPWRNRIDDMQYLAAVHNRLCQHVLFSHDADALMYALMKIDKRNLILTEDRVHFTANISGEISVDTARSSNESNIGCTVLMEELVAHVGVRRSLGWDAQADKRRRDDFAKIGIRALPAAWHACKEISLDFAIDRLLPEAAYAQAEESYRRQSGPDPDERHRYRMHDQAMLLLYGRCLVSHAGAPWSSANPQTAADVLQLNARQVTNIRGHGESTWIAVESLRIIFHQTLCLGDSTQSVGLLQEAFALVRNRAHERFDSPVYAHHIDTTLVLRLYHLVREHNFAVSLRGFLDDPDGNNTHSKNMPLSGGAQRWEEGSPLDSMIDDTKQAFQVWKAHKSCDNEELCFELGSQAVRFWHILSLLQVDEIASLIDDDILRQWVHWVTQCHADMINETEPSAVVVRAFMEKVAPEAVEATLDKTDSIIHDDALLQEKIQQARSAGFNPRIAVDNLAAKSKRLEEERCHWYQVARYRVLAASIAKMFDIESAGSAIADGKSVAEWFGRADWIRMIESVNDDPRQLLRLMVR
ncbi:hypothetical protein [Nocardia arthritidis]|uniref:hypothetical protein n=1 Tax=Nocardia arthritidis TaxID=228602 RepID=UPI0012EDB19E|nr:hypothetical protein [Nocardia arthritidis]